MYYTFNWSWDSTLTLILLLATISIQHFIVAQIKYLIVVTVYTNQWFGSLITWDDFDSVLIVGNSSKRFGMRKMSYFLLRSSIPHHVPQVPHSIDCFHCQSLVEVVSHVMLLMGVGSSGSNKIFVRLQTIQNILSLCHLMSIESIVLT